MKKKIKKIRHVFEYSVVIVIYHLIRLLPLKVLFILADAIGFVLFLIPPFKRLCCANLKVAFPEKADCEIRRIARSSLQNISKTAMEFFWFQGREDYLFKITSNKEAVQNLIKNKREDGGIMWISAHLGNWELASLNAKYLGSTPMAVIVRRQDNPYINNLITKIRKSTENSVIYEKGAIRKMFRAVKNKSTLALLIDQNTKVRDGALFVNFFGLPVPTSKAVAFFARKTKINIAFVFCLREHKSYELQLKELPKKTKDYNSDEEITQDIMKIIEETIRQYPKQYLWLYKRWQNIPKDSSPELEKKYPYYAKKASEKFYDKSAKKYLTKN